MSAIGIVIPVFFPGASKLEDPHCTLMYLGEYGKVDVDRHVVEEATARLRGQCTPQMIEVKGLEVFGHGTCTVLTLADLRLKSYRDFLAKELARDGIRSASEYSYNPHVTINKHTVSSEPIFPFYNFEVPKHVWIDRPTVWWNGER
jgi:2'-5' RNA ligase